MFELIKLSIVYNIYVKHVFESFPYKATTCKLYNERIFPLKWNQPIFMFSYSKSMCLIFTQKAFFTCVFCAYSLYFP